jgi:hypothetical protein
MRLVDMNGDQRNDVLVVAKEAAHLCMLCARGNSQIEFLCDYCGGMHRCIWCYVYMHKSDIVCPHCKMYSPRQYISEEKHHMYHDTVQAGEPGHYDYSMYLFLQKEGGTFEHCHCDPVYLGTDYYPKSLLVDKGKGRIAHLVNYPKSKRDRYIYKWNKRSKQIENW